MDSKLTLVNNLKGVPVMSKVDVMSVVTGLGTSRLMLKTRWEEASFPRFAQQLLLGNKLLGLFPSFLFYLDFKSVLNKNS